MQVLRRAWVNQFYIEVDRISWRDRADLPPTSLRFDSPYDPDARFGNKRSTTWSGYKAHLTEPVTWIGLTWWFMSRRHRRRCRT